MQAKVYSINQVLKFPISHLTVTVNLTPFLQLDHPVTCENNKCYFCQLISEKNTSTPIIWHIVGKPYNWLNFIGSKTWKAMEEISWHNSSFPSSVFCNVFPSCGKVYCSSFHCLLSLFLVSFPNNLNYCCQ